MGFWKKLKELFSRRPPARDVSSLPGDRGTLDLVEEQVQAAAGGPLSPGHLRRALRDPRLLPKRRTVGKPPRQMEADLARRLFSGTLRTRDRRLRDLLPDPEQLARYGLPLWSTEAELAAALDLSVKQLRFFSVHRPRDQQAHYVTFAIPKRRGGERLIMAPKRRLKQLQRRLNELLVRKLPLSDHAHGFRLGRSIRSGALPHVGQKHVVHLDLEDFFPTVSFGRVRGLLVALGYGYPVATVLAVLMTEAERQPVQLEGASGGRFLVPVGRRHCPQGAPTSPGLCNAVCLRLDRRLAGLARHLGAHYTRYADDLTFSGPALEVGALLGGVRRIVEAEGFRLNREKTRIQPAGQRQTVTGVVVNDTLGLSRQHRRKLRAGLHQQARLTPEQRASLEGQLAYLAMLNPEQAARLRGR